MIRNKKLDVDLNENFNSYVNIIINELTDVLVEICEELNTNANLFKQGMHRIVSRMLNYIKNTDDNIFLFPDSIPGFAVMCIKKKSYNQETTKTQVIEVDELKSVTKVLEEYTKKTSCHVITIESLDLILSFFPTDDNEIRKSLKNLGLYSSY